MRVVLPHLRFRTLPFVLFALLRAAPVVVAQPSAQQGAQQTESGTSAQKPGAPEPRPRLFVYSQHRLPEESWAALLTALQADLPEAVAQVPAGEANVEFIRGDDPAKVDLTGQGITVYLRGDCSPSVLRLPFPQGEGLGWVSKVDGVIVPIIHVECTRVGEAISGQTQWMNRNERTAAMAGAIARVVLHEWVHIATQSAAHGSDGISKAKFSTEDLLCADPTPNCAGSTKKGSDQLYAKRRANSPSGSCGNGKGSSVCGPAHDEDGE